MSLPWLSGEENDESTGYPAGPFSSSDAEYRELSNPHAGQIHFVPLTREDYANLPTFLCALEGVNQQPEGTN